MESVNNISTNLLPNKTTFFYYDISPLEDVVSFETFNLSEDSLNGYLAFSDDSNMIFICSISETKEISIEQTIEINCKKIQSIKYFNNNDKNYLVVLVNESNKIIIFEIKNINTFQKIYEHENNHCYRSGYSGTKHNIKFMEYLLLFKDNKVYLVISYNEASGCCSRSHVIEIYDIKENILTLKYSCESNVFYISLIQWKNSILKFCKYLTFPIGDYLIIYDFFNQKNNADEENRFTDSYGNQVIYEELCNQKNYITDTIKNAGGEFLFINDENNLHYIYSMISKDKDTTLIIKTSLKQKEIITKIELTLAIQKLVLLNEKYSILIEKNSNKIKLLNLENWEIEIEKDFQNENGNENVKDAKIVVINKDEKLIVIKTDTNKLFFIGLNKIKNS